MRRIRARCLGQPPDARLAAFTISVENRVENLPHRQFFFGIPRRAADCTNMVRYACANRTTHYIRDERAAANRVTHGQSKNEKEKISC